MEINSDDNSTSASWISKAFTSRSAGIIYILIGTGLLAVSIIFSSQSAASGSVMNLEIVILEGRYVPEKVEYQQMPEGLTGLAATYERERLRQVVSPAHTEGRLVIPTKYPMSISIVFVLLGAGILALGKSPAANQ